MPSDLKLAAIVGLLALATVAGLIWRATTGRAKRIKSGLQIDLKEIGAIKNGLPVTKFGEHTTFLQFSSETCATCKQTARLFDELEKTSNGVLHIEVDLTHRLDLADKFGILQTPTTLVLDSKGIVKARIGGAPKPSTIEEEIGHFVI
ncbi:MAG: thioredoxin family protein [Micrococcales bacterium]